jgi:hypothetical protein
MASDVLAWHEASLTTMGGRHDIVLGRDIIQLWESARAPIPDAIARLATSRAGCG